jgi:hypothetical protein
MKSISETKDENNSSNNASFDSLIERIEDLEHENDLLNSEIAAFQRLIWSNFEELIDNASLLRKAKSELGEERFKKIYADYIKNEKSAIFEEHKQKAIKELFILDFTEVYELLSGKIPDTKMQNS